MDNLTSIAEHSDYLEKTFKFDSVKWALHRNRVNFGKQILEKWMFVPCDEYGNILEEPKEYFDWYKWGDFSKYGKSITPKCKEYHQAKERCLFHGFESIPYTNSIRIKNYVIDLDYTENSTIETLLKHEIEFILTPTAKKQIES